MEIELYTDGACSPNPGKGGYGIVLKFGEHRKEISAGFKLTTNNRMELLAVIVGLESIKDTDKTVFVFSDSKYVIDAINFGWVYRWKRESFAKTKNPDLWKRFLAIHNQVKHRFFWIKGHNGHVENERCDRLAVEASKGSELLEDPEFNSKDYPVFKKPRTSTERKYKVSLEWMDELAGGLGYKRFSYKPEHGGVSYRHKTTKSVLTVFLTTLTVCAAPKGKNCIYLRKLEIGMLRGVFAKYC